VRALVVDWVVVCWDVVGDVVVAVVVWDVDAEVVGWDVVGFTIAGVVMVLVGVLVVWFAADPLTLRALAPEMPLVTLGSFESKFKIATSKTRRARN